MKIVIPTYRRHAEQRTFAGLPQHWKDLTMFVCDEEDAVRLRFKYGKTTRAQYVVVPDTIKTIAQKRAWIIKNEGFHFPEKILMLDDDLKFDARIPGTNKLLGATPNQIHAGLVAIEIMLDTYRHVGISPRQGNNNMTEQWVPNTRMVYALGYHLPTLREHCELGRIETREDFDYNLQLLKKGFENRLLTDLTVDQKYNAPGGCSTDRTIESSNADAVKLAALHPGIVKVVEKEYSTSISRKEVICYWKKALNAGI